MPLAIPAQLKKISPYVKRAEELDRDKSSPVSRLVAYYCRQYAVHTGIPLVGSAPEAKVCLGHLLENLEAEKPAMDNFTRPEAAYLCRDFAYKVFDKADAEDRMGLANKITAKNFYAASTFLQILEQFYDPDNGDSDEAEKEMEDKKKKVYAKWKSTEILNAIKEGRTPTPGGYGEVDLGEEEEEDEGGKPAPTASSRPTPPSTVVPTQEDDEEEVIPMAPPAAPSRPMSPPAMPPAAPAHYNKPEEGEEGTEVELGPPPAYQGFAKGPSVPAPARVDRPPVRFDPAPPMAPDEQGEQAPVSSRLPAPPAAPPAAAKKSTGGLFGFGSKKPSASQATKAQISDATELTRFALAALEDKNADLAVERLRDALNALGAL